MRNTELAETEGGKKVSNSILTSKVATNLRRDTEERERQRLRAVEASRSNDEILLAAEACKTILKDMISIDEANARGGVVVQPSELIAELLLQAQLAEAQLAEAVAASSHGTNRRAYRTSHVIILDV